MLERELNRKLAAGLAAQGVWVHVVPDQARGVKKPCDILACRPGGRFWMIEGKRAEIPSWYSKAQLLHPRSFEVDQLPLLLRIERDEGLASIALYVVPPRTAETRVWLLGVRGVAARFQAGGVVRLEDLLTAPDCYELVRLPPARWGLGHDMLQQCQDPTANLWCYDDGLCLVSPAPSVEPST